jgi:hypothetical protein
MRRHIVVAVFLSSCVEAATRVGVIADGGNIRVDRWHADLDVEVARLDAGSILTDAAEMVDTVSFYSDRCFALDSAVARVDAGVRDAVLEPRLDPAVQVSCSAIDQRCLRTRAGRLHCWGNLGDEELLNAPRLVPIERPAIHLSAEHQQVLAVDDQQKVWAWGFIPPSVFGLECSTSQDVLSYSRLPRRVDAFGDVADASTRWGRLTLTTRSGAVWMRAFDGACSGTRWVRTWSSHARRFGMIDEAACAVTDAGALECMRAGSPNIDPRFQSLDLGPTPVVQWTPTPVVDVSLGYYGQCVIDHVGDLYCWGAGGRGHLGLPSSEWLARHEYFTPRRVAGLSQVRQVQFNRYEVMALTADGTLWAWGPLGRGIDVAGPYETCPDARFGTCVNTPSRVMGVRDVVNFAACHGDGYCAVTREGRVFCTGNRSGDGTARVRYSPVEVRWE